ncbi:unnamed protein product, partial [Didymodactylos carnosus]
MFGLLWWHNIPFDLELFAIAFVLFQTLRFTLLWAFPEAFLSSQQYRISQKRIE